MSSSRHMVLVTGTYPAGFGGFSGAVIRGKIHASRKARQAKNSPLEAVWASGWSCWVERVLRWGGLRVLANGK